MVIPPSQVLNGALDEPLDDVLVFGTNACGKHHLASSTNLRTTIKMLKLAIAQAEQMEEIEGTFQ